MAKLFYALLLIFSASVQVFAFEPIYACGDVAQWPPYGYYKDQKHPGEVTGISVELLQQISLLIDIPIILELMPWKRCMMEVEFYKKNKLEEIFIDGSLNEERLEKFYVTTPIYSTHMGIYYSSKRFPKGVPDFNQDMSLLNQYSLCGILGYNYEMMGKVGVTAHIDTASRDTLQAMQRVLTKRCDLFITSLEPIVGQVITGQIILDPDLKSYTFTKIEQPTFHVFISKGSLRGAMLLAYFNQAIISLQHNGIAQTIFNKYVPSLGDGL